MEVTSFNKHGARTQTDRFKFFKAQDLNSSKLNKTIFYHFLLGRNKADYMSLLRRTRSERVFKVTTTQGVWFL